MTRRATLRTAVAAAETVAAALRPDNTAEMTTHVEGDAVVTTIERDSTGGLRTTVDDYVVNLTVASELVQTIDRLGGTPGTDDGHPTGPTTAGGTPEPTDDTQP